MDSHNFGVPKSNFNSIFHECFEAQSWQYGLLMDAILAEYEALLWTWCFGFMENTSGNKGVSGEAFSFTHLS